jgi:hypothetical protein
MPEISFFYGIKISLYFDDSKKHNLPHIHVKYGAFTSSFAIDDGRLIKGKFPKSQSKLVQAWIEIHKKELMDDWQIAVNGGNPFRIDPLT